MFVTIDMKNCQGLGWGETYINPPKGPPTLSDDLEYKFSGAEPPRYRRST